MASLMPKGMKGLFQSSSSSSEQQPDVEGAPPPMEGKPAAEKLCEYMDSKDLNAIGTAHFGKYMEQYNRPLCAALLPFLMCKAPLDVTNAVVSPALWKDVATLAVAPRLGFILLLAANVFLGAAGAIITFDLIAMVLKPASMLIYATFLSAVTLGWTYWYSPLIGAACSLGYAFMCLRELAGARVLAIPFAAVQARRRLPPRVHSRATSAARSTDRGPQLACTTPGPHRTSFTDPPTPLPQLVCALCAVGYVGIMVYKKLHAEPLALAGGEVRIKFNAPTMH